MKAHVVKLSDWTTLTDIQIYSFENNFNYIGNYITHAKFLGTNYFFAGKLKQTT